MPSDIQVDILRPLPPEVEKRVEHIEDLAKMMDSQFSIPGTRLKLGIDTLIGLIPGIGDTLSLGIAGYIVLQARQVGARKDTLMLMLFNIFIDWLIGLVPIIGDFLIWVGKAIIRMPRYYAPLWKSYITPNISARPVPSFSIFMAVSFTIPDITCQACGY